uniref:Uncharacterized protein n=1 Tax=viral metagenome TaxID=1070528 RepID=A0A6C0JN51_9ZZZZ
MSQGSLGQVRGTYGSLTNQVLTQAEIALKQDMVVMSDILHF